MKTKEKRQAQILKLISANEVETQEEITLYLQNHGFIVTQATVSRDIKELNLVKTSGDNKRYKYVSSESSAGNVSNNDFSSLLRDGVLSAVASEQMVVLRCRPGMAQAIAAVIDNRACRDILGTIAGDDTIFICLANIDSAKEFAEDVYSYIVGRKTC